MVAHKSLAELNKARKTNIEIHSVMKEGKTFYNHSRI